MNWDEFRRADKSINLCAAFDKRPCPQSYNNYIVADAKAYLCAIEAMQKIESRQAAAQAIATAEWLAVTRG